MELLGIDCIPLLAAGGYILIQGLVAAAQILQIALAAAFLYAECIQALPEHSGPILPVFRFLPEPVRGVLIFKATQLIADANELVLQVHSAAVVFYLVQLALQRCPLLLCLVTPLTQSSEVNTGQVSHRLFALVQPGRGVGTDLQQPFALRRHFLAVIVHRQSLHGDDQGSKLRIAGHDLSIRSNGHHIE